MATGATSNQKAHTVYQEHRDLEAARASTVNARKALPTAGTTSQEAQRREERDERNADNDGVPT